MNKVKYYRLISGLLLKDLSEKTGLSVGHLSHIENGNKQPSTSLGVLLYDHFTAKRRKATTITTGYHVPVICVLVLRVTPT